MIRRRPGFTMIELVVVVAIIAVLISLLLPAVQSAREAARRTQCANNLCQLGIALENYESTNLVLPPGVTDRAGPVVESPTGHQFGWAARILPYLEQRNVYNRLDFDASVYAASNLTARGVALNVLFCPSDPQRSNFRNRAAQTVGAGGTFAAPEPTTSAFAACHNDVEAPIDVGNTGVFFLNSRVRLDEIEDGLSHTIFLGEKRGAGDELGWASGTRATLRNTGTPLNQTDLDPADTFPFQMIMAERFRPKDPAEAASPPPPLPPSSPNPIPVGGFGSWHPVGTNFLFGDGSVRHLRTGINLTVFRRLGGRADGEPIGDDQL